MRPCRGSQLEPVQIVQSFVFRHKGRTRHAEVLPDGRGCGGGASKVKIGSCYDFARIFEARADTSAPVPANVSDEPGATPTAAQARTCQDSTCSIMQLCSFRTRACRWRAGSCSEPLTCKGSVLQIVSSIRGSKVSRVSPATTCCFEVYLYLRARTLYSATPPYTTSLQKNDVGSSLFCHLTELVCVALVRY